MSTANEQENKTASRYRDLLLIVGFAFLILLPAARLRPPARQQELRVLISARNMVESGDWIRPEFQNQPRFRKPPLPYWMAAAAMLPDRLTDSAARARLPFIFAAVGALLVLYRLSGSKIAPLLLLGCFGFYRYAPLAETDMINTLGICLSMLGFHKKISLLTALGMSASILSKGPAGLVIPLITFLCLIPRDRRSLMCWLSALGPPLLAGAAWVVFLLRDPVAAAALQTEMNETFINAVHSKNPLYYFYTLPAMLGPALLLGFPRQRPRPAFSLPWVWFAVTFGLLSLTDSKQNHYALMLLPPSVWLLSLTAPRKTLIPGLALIACIWVGADLWRSQTHEDAAHSRFLASVQPKLEAAPTLYVVGINSARFDFHLGRHVHNRESAGQAFRHAQPGDAVVIVQPRARYDSIEVISPHDASDETWIRRLVIRP